MKVKITEYKNVLIIETLEPEKDDNFIPVTEKGKIGSVLINTKEHLGISKEALKFMKGLKSSTDDIGEIDSWKTKDGKDCFGWIGPLSRLVGSKAELSNRGFQDIDFIEIPNKPPIKAKTAIDKENKEE